MYDFSLAPAFEAIFELNCVSDGTSAAMIVGNWTTNHFRLSVSWVTKRSLCEDYAKHLDNLDPLLRYN